MLKRVFENELRFSCHNQEAVIADIRRGEAGPTMLELTGLWNNACVTAIMSKLPSDIGGEQSSVPAVLPTIVQLRYKLGLAIRQAQRATRCLCFLDQGKQVFARLARELENTG